MKAMAKKIALLLVNALMVLALLCSCGSDLDGTWTSQADKNTKIKFSGHKVKVSYGSFKLSGTYEEDEEDSSVITLDLTDEDGNKYRIIATKSIDKNILSLENGKGQTETFKK